MTKLGVMNLRLYPFSLLHSVVRQVWWPFSHNPCETKSRRIFCFLSSSLNSVPKPSAPSNIRALQLYARWQLPWSPLSWNKGSLDRGRSRRKLWPLPQSAWVYSWGKTTLQSSPLVYHTTLISLYFLDDRENLLTVRIPQPTTSKESSVSPVHKSLMI